MISISLCMIVKNEEEVLARCLESVKEVVDEIIVIDTGSTDKTKEIAEQFGAKIYDFEWIDDFSAARNYSFSKATKDYIFWLDADDVLILEEKSKFKTLKTILDPSIDVVMMKYNLGVNSEGKPTLTFFRERLLKREKNFKWYEQVHEYLDFGGKIVNVDISINHMKLHSSSKRNLNIFQKMLSEGKDLSSRNCFYYARELFYNAMYDDAIVYYNKFLDTEGGYLSNYIDSCIDLSKCYGLRNDKKRQLSSLFKSFEHDTPRGEVCTYIGYYFKENKDYLKAIFWFDLATKLKKPENSWGFIIHDMWGFIPTLELSICYYLLGKVDEAIKYNDLAAQFKPNHPAVVQNRTFLESVRDNAKTTS